MGDNKTLKVGGGGSSTQLGVEWVEIISSTNTGTGQDGNFRIRVNADVYELQKRVSGSWVNRETFN